MSPSPTDAEADNEEEYHTGWDALYAMVRGVGSFSGREMHCAFLNTGADRYADFSAVSGLHFDDDGRAVAVVDWDQDGGQDLWLCDRSGPRVRFLRNALSGRRPFLAVQLEGRTCNRDAIGARVEVHLRNKDGRARVKTLRAADGYLAQSSKWLHFGLGPSPQINHVTVAWPGGEVAEFRGLEAGHHYRLVQGTGSAQEWIRPGDTPRLAGSDLTSPQVSDQARIVLAARVPMPRMTYQQFDGATVPLISGATRPLFINLWASWCAPCAQELGDLAGHRQELGEAGLRVVALNVEEESERAKATAMLERVHWPYESGVAAPETLDMLDTLQRAVLDRQRPLPLPSSFLVDRQSRLAVIYKGPIDAQKLLNDLTMLDYDAERIRASAAAFPGRWFVPPPQPDLAGLSNKFRRLGFVDAAAQYLEAYRAQTANVEVHGRQQVREAAFEYNLGVALVRQGKFKEAKTAYERALTADPKHVPSHVNLGIVLKKLGDIEGAVKQYEQALALNPNHVLAHHNLAIALAELGRIEEAQVHYLTAQELRAEQNAEPK